MNVDTKELLNVQRAHIPKLQQWRIITMNAVPFVELLHLHPKQASLTLNSGVGKKKKVRSVGPQDDTFLFILFFS